MRLTANDIIVRAARILSDNTNVRWTPEELEDYAKDGVRNIILVRPDAYSITRYMTIEGGTSMQIVGNTSASDNKGPSDEAGFDPCMRVLRVICNDDKGAYEPIREASRVALDSEVMDWHAPTGSIKEYRVKHYVFDNISPYTIYLYPAPPLNLTDRKIQIVHSALPSFAASGAHTYLGLPEQYMSPILDWTLYRAFSKDAEYAGNMDRANHHLQAFATTLGLTRDTAFAAATPQQATPLPAGSNWQRTGR